MAAAKKRKTREEVLESFGIVIPEPTPEQYGKAVRAIAMRYCPPIVTCKICGYPRLQPYICETCGIDEAVLTE